MKRLRDLLCLLAGIFSLAMHALPLRADGLKPDSPPLPGSFDSLTQCVWGTNIIFVGKLTHMEKNLKLENNCIHITLQFAPTQHFEGSFAPESTFTAQVIWLTGGYHEDLPRVGESYLVFAFHSLQAAPNSYAIEKLAPGTESNAATVARMLANPPSPKLQPNQKLPGDNLTPEDALSRSDSVLVATILELGPVAADAVDSYGLSKARVSQTLFGPHYDIAPFFFAAGRDGPPPEVGGTYIFFSHTSLESGWGAVEVSKFMPATDENIAMAKAFVAKALEAKANAPTTIAKESESERLPGSSLNIKDAVAQADFIFVAAASDNVMYFTQTLRGASDNTSSNAVYVHYDLDSTRHEAAPKDGTQYIYIIRKPASNGSYTAIKILPATTDNVTKVKQLIWPSP